MKRWIAGILAGLLCAMPLGAWAAPDSVEVSRVAGADRYQTAVLIAQNAHSAAERVVIAGGDAQPDAMVGGALAGALSAPLLFTESERLSASTAEALKQWKPKDIIVVGGTASVSDEVIEALQAYGRTTRVSGSDRFDTAKKVETVATSLGAKAENAVVTSATSAFDQSAAVALAAKGKGPLRLYRGDTPRDSAWGVGGAVPSGYAANNIVGTDRIDTALRVAAAAFADAKTVVLAADSAPADALAAQALSVQHKAPVLFLKNGSLTPAVSKYLREAKVQRVVVAGGDAHVPDSTLTALSHVHAARDLAPNELGSVLILMYHHINETGNPYSTTPDQFRHDLKVLYENGYLPVLMSDFLKGEIDIPYGWSPVVLTFDDGYRNNIMCLDDDCKEIDPNTGAGILIEFAKKHPLFRPHASYYITQQNPFGSVSLAPKKIEALYRHGMEIGNHSKNHPHFSRLNAAQIQEEIAYQHNFLSSLTGGKHKPTAFCLPYGDAPQDEYLPLLRKGSSNGISYDYDAVIYVKERHQRSPFHVRFDPFRVYRMGIGRPYPETIEDKLAYYDKNPSSRFVSDGDPSTVTIPSNWKDVLGTLPKGKTLQVGPAIAD